MSFKALFVSNDETYYVNIVFPHEILGPTTIVGALPEKDLVMLANEIQTPDTGPILSNPYINAFNKENTIYGNILIIQTNQNGDPIDISDNNDI